MAALSPPPPPPAPESSRLLAAIDMGTNSFKLLLARALPSGRFLPLHRLKFPVALGRCRLPDGSLPLDSQLRALSALRSFSLSLRSLPVDRTRAVATSAVREAPNRADFLARVHSEQGLGFQIDVLSGEEEARLIYLGVLQFLPHYKRSVLAIDIGGGSTEFVIGKEGRVLFATSLNLGHVSLTESYVEKGRLGDLRRHVRMMLHQSSLVEKVREFGFEVAVGSSGTIRSIERAVFFGGGDDELMRGNFSREWRFSRGELGSLVEELCGGLDLGEVGGARRLGFSRRRGEFIVAGALLLLEIFEALGINELEVSGYALGEGVVAEMLAGDSPGYDLNVNARWRSVVGLAVRFDGENRMKMAIRCAGIAKDIFNGISMCGVVRDEETKSVVCLEEKYFEYVEAAILLHNIGKLMGKKGYHKLSYRIIQHGGHLYGYSSEEIQLVALLVRFHRKKFPRCRHEYLKELSVEMMQKFRVFCVIIRLSLALQQCQSFTIQGVEVKRTHEGLKLVLSGLKDQLLLSHGMQLTSAAVEEEIRPELAHFEEVFQQKIGVSENLIISASDLEKPV